MPLPKKVLKHPIFNHAQNDGPIDLDEVLKPIFDRPKYRLTPSPSIEHKAISQRWSVLSQLTEQSVLCDEATYRNSSVYDKNIEYFIGTAKVPLGIAGPLRVNGTNARDDFLVPLATTEAALVASYHRGAKLITASGGASAMVINEGVTRSPVFQFSNLSEAGQFVAWVVTQYDNFKELVKTTTSHGRLHDVSVNIEGNHVYLVFEYHTGDASGQNMVTIATHKVFNFIKQKSPIGLKQATWTAIYPVTKNQTYTHCEVYVVER